jgi:DNA polymerase-4
LHELSDSVEHYSIDEAFLDLSGWYRDAAEASFALSRVKRRIQEEVGEWLRCSVGLAPTRFLSKFASERKKPDGLTVITPENLDEHLATADLEDACGIGPRIRRRLVHLGITTLLELKRAPVGNLMRAFGKNGFYLWAKVNGVECERVGDGEAAPKSIGHSYCVPHRVNREKKVEAVLVKLTERAGRRLRSHGLLAGVLSIVVGIRHAHVSYSDFVRLPEPADDLFTLTRAIQKLLRSIWRGQPVDFLAVTFMELSVPTQQLRLSIGYDADRQIQWWDRTRAVSRSLDAIRDRYGETSVVLGRMFSLLEGDEHAPDRIGFRKTWKLEIRNVLPVGEYTAVDG